MPNKTIYFKNRHWSRLKRVKYVSKLVGKALDRYWDIEKVKKVLKGDE